MLDRSASSSTSRRPSEITDWLLRHPPQRQPDRDRGLWRFLTWPFFLAQVMIAGPFLGSGAQAALEENDAGLKQTPHNSGATADDLPSIGARSVLADDASETGSDVKVASHPASRFHHLQQFEEHSTGAHPYRLSEFNPAIGGAGGGGDGDDGGGDSGGGGRDDASSEYETSAPFVGSANTPVVAPLPPVGPSGATLDGHVGMEGPSDGVEANVGLQVGSAEFAHLGLNATDIGEFGLPLHAAAGTQLVSLDAGFDMDVDVAHLGSNLASLLGPEVGIELAHIIGAPVSLVTGLALGSLPDEIGRLPLIGDGGATALQSARSVGAEARTLVQSAGELTQGMLAGESSSVANIVSVTDFALLQNKGDVSSGDKIVFPEAPTINVAQVDQLFVAGRYTDYHLALQSDANSAVTKSIGSLHNETFDHLAGPLATADSSADKHDTGSPAAQTEQHAIAFAHLPMGGLRSGSA
jgi:hypothetical protein